MTVVLICLVQGLSKEEYVERLKRESLATEDANLQNMLQDLKFDQNFAHNTIPSLFQHENPANVLINDPAADQGQHSSGEASKSADQFITPSESPHHDECKFLLFLKQIISLF